MERNIEPPAMKNLQAVRSSKLHSGSESDGTKRSIRCNLMYIYSEYNLLEK